MAYTAFSVAQDEVPDATKWNTLGANDAHFYTFLAMDLAWTSWTPTWTGITKGGATVTAYYTKIGNIVFGRIHFVYGSGTVMTGTPIFTFPVTAHADFTSVQHVIGCCYLEDLGTSGHSGHVRNANTTTGQVIIQRVDGTYVENVGISTTGPFSWASGDYFSLSFMYEAA